MISRNGHDVGTFAESVRTFQGGGHGTGQSAEIRSRPRTCLSGIQAALAGSLGNNRGTVYTGHPLDRQSSKRYGLWRLVELEPGVEGLVHVSEMSWSKRVKHPSKLVNAGDTVEVEVLGVDSKARRIS